MSDLLLKCKNKLEFLCLTEHLVSTRNLVVGLCALAIAKLAVVVSLILLASTPSVVH